MADDNAHKVLDIFTSFDSHAGDVLLSNNFIAVGARRRWRMEELQDGIDAAHRSGWIEGATRGWRLTPDGFREAAKRH